MSKIVAVQSAITAKLEELNMTPSDIGVDVQAGKAKTAKRELDRKEEDANTKRAKGEPPAGESSMDDIDGEPLHTFDEVLGSIPNVKMVFVIVIAHVQAFIAQVHVQVNRSCITHASCNAFIVTCIYKNRSHVASIMIPSISITDFAGPGS